MISSDNTLSNTLLSVHEVIVIDSLVTDWKVLIAGLNPALPVVLLPAEGDGLAALAEALAPYGQLDALHLVSHGGSGYLLLGAGQLNSATLAAGGDTLASLASHFTADSDLLLYGCSVAAGVQGEAFVTALSAGLHGADIAASTDLTGPVSLGGDWVLEYTTGTLESVLPFTEQAMQEIEMNFGGSDPIGITLTQAGGATAVTEGGATDSYTVVLNSAPTADVTIALDDTNHQVSLSTTTLTFTTANWSTPQTVTVTAVNDTVGEGMHTGVIHHTITSSDSTFNALAALNVQVAVTDNDLPASDPAFQAAQSDPFGLSNAGGAASPTFVDIDADGDLDAFVGNKDGDMLFFLNSGSAGSAAFLSGAEMTPFGLSNVVSYATPTFVDIDADGDLDAFAGNKDGDTVFFRNSGSAGSAAFASPETNLFGLSNVGVSARPTFVDIDGDGDLDAFVGNSVGETRLFLNTGSASSAAFASAEINPFGLSGVGLNATPTFVDIDGDGVLDALVGNKAGDILLFRNTGSTSSPAFASAETNPFGLSNEGGYATPTFVDIDGDGDLDAFVGNIAGDTLFFLNLPDTTAPTLSSSTPADSATGIAPSANIALVCDENIAAGTGTITLVNVSTGATVETFNIADSDGTNGDLGGNASISGSTLTINPGSNLAEATQYAVQISATAVKDSANNAFAGIADTTTLNFTTGVIDSTAPALLAIQRTAAEATTAATLTYTLVFSEAVTNVDASDFVVSTTGTATGSVTSVTGSGNTRTVTVETVTGTGKIGLSLNTGHAITDIAGNALPDGNPADNEAYTVDRTLPTLLSLNRLTAGDGATNADSVQFLAVFSEAVSGLAAGDFALTGTATTGASITSVSGNGSSVITITVDSVGGDGTLGVALAASPTITDAIGNGLSNISPTSTIAESYTIDNSAPTAVSILRSAAELTSDGSVTFDVVFNESVQNLSVDDFALTGTATGTIASVTGSGSAYTVTVSSVAGDGALGLSYAGAQNISDAGGNAFAGVLPLRDESYTVDKTAPAVTAISRAGVNQIAASTATNAVFTVLFSEAVTGVAADDFAVTGNASHGAVSVSSADGKVFQVTVADVNGTVDQTLGLNFTGSVNDALSQTGNAQFITGQTYTIGGVLFNEGAIDQAGLDALAGANHSGTLLLVDAVGTASEVVILDSRLPGMAALMDGVHAGTDVWLLDAGSSALGQIGALLGQYHNLSAVHLLSHGSSGEIYLGAETISASTLASQSATLSEWGHALSDTGDLLVYGCNVGAGEAGQHFIVALATATSADVAASDDLTGSSWLGGDWALETNAGVVDAASVLSVVDYTGIILGGTDPTFQTAQSNPFGLSSVVSSATPTLVDIDADGDLDAFVGTIDGDTLFFRNTGSASSAAFASAVSNPFGLSNVGFYASPTLVDIDGDGDLDAFVGERYGNTLFFRNTGSASSAAFLSAATNPFGLSNVGRYATPTFVDIDGDGDLDAFVGDRNGNTLFFRNTGSASSAAFSAAATNPFGLSDVGNLASPTLVDIDGDGDLDAFVGNNAGNTLFFRNTGSASNAAFSAAATNPFGLSHVGTNASPTLVDIDGDGDLDAFVGNLNGNTLFFLNVPPCVTITQTGGTTAVIEGGATDTYTVVLASAPTANVTITLDDTNGQVSFGSPTLTFTSANWSTAQTVTVTAVNDTVGEGVHTGVIHHTASSLDANYNNIAIANLVVAVGDNDLPVGDRTFQTAQSNPFGLSDVGIYASPTLVDIDGDGDLDAFVGEINGNTLFFLNTGSASSAAFLSAATNPFGLSNVDSFASPTLVDIDGDGDLDAFVGNNAGNTLFFLNTGSASSAAFSSAVSNPFGLIDVGNLATPTFVDIDGDGDLDAFVGNLAGNTLFFLNTGSASNAAFSAAATNPFGLSDVGSYASPTFVDIDGDGDLDAFVCNKDGNTLFFRNTGSASIAAFSAATINPFGLSDVGSYASPTLVDIDGDGDLDAFVGNSSGNTLFFLNEPPPPPGITITQTGGTTAVIEGGATDTYTVKLASAPTSDVVITLDDTNGQVSFDTPTLTFTSANWSTAQTVTVTAVNDTVGEGAHRGVIHHTASSLDANYNNISIANLVVAVGDNDLPVGDRAFQTAVTNPFGLSDVGSIASPTFVDIDGDGDLDAFVGERYGSTLFFLNTGSASIAAFSAAATNPFGLIDVGNFATPMLVDIDGDGDLDAFVGNTAGDTLFFRNTGSASSAAFSSAVSNPFGLIDVGNAASPTFVDIDGDGDLDAFVGNSNGDLLFFRNTGSASSAAFSAAQTNPFGLSDVGSNVSPTFVDTDGDGDLDAFVGNNAGNTLFFRNTGSASSAAFSAAVGNPFGLIDVGVYANPTFVDIDGDGDLDAFVGNNSGNTLFFLNVPANAVPAFTGDTTPADGTHDTGLTVNENAVATDIATLLAVTDTDSGQTLTWSVVSGQGPSHGTLGGFSTSPTAASGTGVTPSSVTYTPTSNYIGSDTFQIQVSDGTATDTVTVTVTVTDVNPSISAATFAVAENSGNATAVGTVTATGDTNGLTYSITGGNTGNVFAINSSTGAITVAGALNYEVTSSYSLTVAVDDEDPDTIADSTATITVNINNLPDAPVLLSATPLDNSTAVAVTSNVILTFDQDVQLGSSGTLTLYDITGVGTNSIAIDVASPAGQLSITGKTLTINPTASLLTTNQYAVQFTAGALKGTTNLTCAAISDTTTLNFTTGTIDTTAPTVTIVDVIDPTQPDAGTVNITFSEQVLNVDISDFTLTSDTGTGAQSVSLTGLAVGGFGSSYSLDLSTVTATAGSYVLTLNPSDITDTTGNALVAGASDTFVIDRTAPTGVALLRASANPSTASSVNFTVAFSEAVTGVDATDFTLTGTAATGASIGTVTKLSDSLYTVAVNTITGDGSLGLDLNSSSTGITDVAGNAISGGLTGQLYTIDNTAPTVTAINRNDAAIISGGSASFTVSFSEAVTGVDASDFTLDLSGVTTTNGDSDISITGSGSTYTVTVANVSGTGTLSVDLKSTGTAIADVVANAIATGFTTGDLYTRDITNPTVTASQAFNLPENMSNGFVIGQVKASDTNGVASYSITSGNTDGFFAIDANGVLTLTPAGAVAKVASSDYETLPNAFTLGITATEWLTENPCFLIIQPHYQRNHRCFYGATGTFLLLTSTARNHELHFGSKSHKLDAPHPLNGSKTSFSKMNSGRFFVRATVSSCILVQQKSSKLVDVA